MVTLTRMHVLLLMLCALPLQAGGSFTFQTYQRSYDFFSDISADAVYIGYGGFGEPGRVNLLTGENELAKGAPESVHGPITLSGDGSRLAYVGEPDGDTRGVYVWDFETSSLITIVEREDTVFESPSISGDGNRVAFYSHFDDPDNSMEVYLADIGAGSIIVLTDTPPNMNIRENWPAAISHDGRVVSFNTDYAYRSEGYITLWREGIGSQVIHPPAPDEDFDPPTMDEAGTRVAFFSSADLVPGQNTQGFGELFHYDIATETLTQITHDAQYPLPQTIPAMSGDGQWTAFVSRASYGGNHPDPTLYLADRNGALCVVIEGVASIGPKINYDGTQIGFAVGDFSELTMATMVDAVPTLSPWGLTLLIASLAMVALYLRRSSYKWRVSSG